jgi:hypothetical protein
MWEEFYKAVVLVDWLWWGETDVSELWPLRAYCSSPGDCDVDHGVRYRLGLTPNSSIRALWQPLVLSGGPLGRGISGASVRVGEGNENLVYPSPCDLKRSLTCRKILRHGTFDFTSNPKEGVLRIFIALKVHRLGRVEPTTFGSSDKHTNHYYTKTTRCSLTYNVRRTARQREYYMRNFETMGVVL